MMTKDIDPAEIGKQAHYIQSKYFFVVSLFFFVNLNEVAVFSRWFFSFLVITVSCNPYAACWFIQFPSKPVWFFFKCFFKDQVAMKCFHSITNMNDNFRKIHYTKKELGVVVFKLIDMPRLPEEIC